jgi:hypothetical protein
MRLKLPLMVLLPVVDVTVLVVDSDEKPGSPKITFAKGPPQNNIYFCDFTLGWGDKL